MEVTVNTLDFVGYTASVTTIELGHGDAKALIDKSKRVNVTASR